MLTSFGMSFQVSMYTHVLQYQVIRDSIRDIPDFPKPGILFWDVTTLMLEPKAFQHTIDLFVERYRGQQVDVVVGVCIITPLTPVRARCTADSIAHCRPKQQLPQSRAYRLCSANGI